MKTGFPSKRNFLSGIVSLCIITQAFFANGQNVWIKATPNIGCAPLQVQFTDSTAPGVVITSWHWDFGDGTISSLQSPVHNYISPGVYHPRLTAQDTTGATDTASTTVIVDAVVFSLTKTDVTCLGACDGIITANVTWGTAPFSIDWSNGGFGQTQTGLCPGTYSVTVTSASGCSGVDSIDIIEPDSLVITVASTDARCAGSCDGTATITVSGGTPPYTYSWSTGDIGPIHAGLCAANYFLTVSDTNGCTAITSVVINEPAPMNTTVTTWDASCNGFCDGSILVVTTGGTPNSFSPPYYFAWSCSGSLDSLITGLCAGPCSATITDGNGCTTTVSATVLEPPPLVVTISATPATPGNCDGTATASVSGGTPPYSYVWSCASQTVATVTGLCAGFCAVTITDGNNCNAVASATVSSGSGPLISVTSTDVLCNGGCTGSATVTIVGGCANPPCSISWWDAITGAPIGGPDSLITNLCAGIYTVQVTDGLGFTTIDSATINESTPLSLQSTVTHAVCPDTTGSINISVSGGTPPYSYLWSNFSITEDISGIPAGIYSVIVTDANNCTASVQDTVNSISGLTTSVSTTPATCSGISDGTATVNVTGGYPPYTYLWDDSSNQTTATAVQLQAGIYLVLVSDTAGCTAVDAALVQDSSAVQVLVVTNPATPGSCNGNATFLASGGLPPYTYQLDSGLTNICNTSVCAGLCAGNYSLTVSDSAGCAAAKSFTIGSGTASEQDCIGALQVCGSVYVQPNAYTGVGNIEDIAEGVSCLQNGENNSVWFSFVIATGGTLEFTISIISQDTVDYDFALYDLTGATCSDIFNGGLEVRCNYAFTDTVTGLKSGFTETSVSASNGAAFCAPLTVMAGQRFALLIDNFGSSFNGFILDFSASTATFDCTDPCDTLVCNDGDACTTDTCTFTAGCINSPIVCNDADVCTIDSCVNGVCVFTSTGCVWPGDANYDGIANNLDVLSIGVAYGAAGPIRPLASLVWVGQPAFDWTDTFTTGINHKHADCDGNGAINTGDTTAVSINYGFTHAKAGPRCTVGPPLIVDMPDTLFPGQAVSAPILLGDVNSSVTDLYGLAFSINYDVDIIDTNTVSISYNNSWMGTPGVNLLGFSKDFYLNAKTDVAITKTDQINLPQNYGQVGTFAFTVKDDVSGKRAMDAVLTVFIDNVTAIDKDENTVFVCGQPDSSVAVIITSGMQTIAPPFIRIYPNPSDEKVYIESNERINRIMLTDMVGRKISLAESQTYRTTLDVKPLSNGTYLLRLEFDDAVEYRKVLVEK